MTSFDNGKHKVTLHLTYSETSQGDENQVSRHLAAADSPTVAVAQGWRIPPFSHSRSIDGWP